MIRTATKPASIATVSLNDEELTLVSGGHGPHKHPRHMPPGQAKKYWGRPQFTKSFDVDIDLTIQVLGNNNTVDVDIDVG